MTGAKRIKGDLKKHAIAIVMMAFLCTLALAGRAQISTLKDSGQITIDSEQEEESQKQEAGNENPRPPAKISDKVRPAE